MNLALIGQAFSEMFENNGHIHVFSPGAGTDNPLGYLCGNVRYNTHLYCLAVQAGFYRNAVECLSATQEILVRSSAGTKGV